MIKYMMQLLGSKKDVDFIEIDYSSNTHSFYNTIYKVQKEGYVFKSAFAEVSFFNNAESIDITWRNNNSINPPTIINIFIDGNLHSSISGDVNNEFSTESVDLPTGYKKIMIRQGATYVSPLNGFDISTIRFNKVSTSSEISFLEKSYRMVTVSDSIGVGSGTQNNGLYAWQVLLRDKLPFMNFLSVGAAGARSSVVQTNDTAQWVVDYLQGASNKIIWYAMGANDTGTDPNVWEVNLANWVDLIHSLDSEINIVLQTMIYREGFETSLDVLRQKERDVASTRSWCNVIEAEDWIPINQYYPDNLLVHPNEEGNLTYSEKVGDVLNVNERIYSLQKYYNWDKAILKIRRDSDDVEKYIFFDGETITLNSYISDDENNPTTDTLGDWIGSLSASVVEWNIQNSFNKVDYFSKLTSEKELKPNFITNGVINLVNNNPSIKFSNRSFLIGNQDKTVDYKKEFTVVTVSSNYDNDANGCILSTLRYNTSTDNRISLYNDRSDSKKAVLVRAGDVDYNAKTLIKNNTSNQKIIAGVFTDSVIKTFLNGDVQESTGYINGYDNIELVVGLDVVNSNSLNGDIQEIRLYNSDKTDSLDSINSEINSIYSIY